MKITDFFQKGFYINLDRRVDRKTQFEEEMKKVGLENFFERVSAFDAKTQPEIAKSFNVDEHDSYLGHHYCAFTYKKLFERILEEGWERVVIFEDDASFYNTTEYLGIEVVEKSLDQLQNITDWGMIYFGGHPSTLHLVDENLAKVEYVLTTHAIGYTRESIQKMLAHKPFDDSAIDGWVSRRKDITKYISYPLAVIQKEGLSDIDASGNSTAIQIFENSFKVAYIEGLLRPQHYVTCEFRGRLGNNMFMIAHCIAQGLRHNVPFFLSKQGLHNYEMYKDNIYKKMDFVLPRIPNEGLFLPERKFSYSRTEPYEHDITIFQGYYQSEKYFKEYEELIRWLFEPNEMFKQHMFEKFPELTNKVVTCINVRRGQDYLALPDVHPVITPEYIYEAMKHIPNTDIYFILSDDLQWCRDNLNIQNAKFIEYSEWEALWLMSLCHHFIISNSSFSWWAAYLSRHENKVVVGPSTWCGPKGPQDTQDILCENWISLPTKFQNGTIIPL